MTFYTWVEPDLVWNEEFNTINDILCIGVIIGGIWAQSSQLATIPQMQ